MIALLQIRAYAFVHHKAHQQKRHHYHKEKFRPAHLKNSRK